MEIEAVMFEDVREDILAAIVHQTRQPLFVLQNDLFAVRHLVERAGDSSDARLLRNYVSEMRSTIDRLSDSLSQIAEFASSTPARFREISKKQLLEETFQIARFCVSRYGVQLTTEIVGSIAGPVTFDAMKFRITVMQWVLRACCETVSDSAQNPSISLRANTVENDLIIYWGSPSIDKSLHLSNWLGGEFISSRPKSSFVEK